MGKTIKNEYEKALSYEALMKAHMQSRKGKGYRKDIILFNLKQEEYIMWLYEQLKTLKYKHGGYKVFYITEPKLRRIEKSKYLDRIVHRWYVNSFIKPYFVPQFIETSYACLENKGMHKACLEVQKTMKHCKNIWEEYYILKMDIKKYFENINKNIVYEILQRKIKDEKVLWLTKEILYSNNGENNLPIGNYTSQMFANIYLNELDQYVKHKLKGKYYFRYMDDAILIRKTKEETKQDLENIKEFLREQLKLELNKKTQIFKNKQGINFCGYKINEYRLKIRDKGKRKLKIKVKKLEEKVKKGIINSKEAKRYLAGHLGYMKIANVKNLKERLFF